jgi:predicted ribosome quality control (RQC) complex YloA/Tae2 family protein
MKSRLTLPDVLALVRDLRSMLLGFRCQNIYDVDDKTFLMKMADPDRGRHILLIESGVRLHTTKFARDHPAIPGGFAMKLRKHLKGRRLTGIAQMGFDRVICLTFGSGELTHHLILELYDRGNVVLTDRNFMILSLLRQYTLRNAPAPGAAAALEDGAAGEGGEEEENAGEHGGKTAGKDGKDKGKGKGKGKHGAKRDAPAPAADSAAAPIRIAVKQKYVFTAESSALRARILGDVDAAAAEASAAAAARAGADAEAGEEGTSADASASGPVAAEGEEGEVQLIGGTASDSNLATGSGGFTPLDLWSDEGELTDRLAHYLLWFETTRIPALPGKVRRKLTIASMLSSKGSGADVFGPAILEHCCTVAGLGADAKLERVKNAPVAAKGAKGGAANADAAAAAAEPSLSSYKYDALLELARALRTVPSLLRSIATQQTDTVAYAFVVPLQQQGSSAGASGSKGGATGDAAMTSLMKQVSGMSVSGTTASSAAAASSSATTAAQSGCLGSWDAAITAVTAAVAAASSASASAPSTPALSGASSSVVDDEQGLGLGAGRSPPSVPYSIVDFAPTLLAQYVDTKASGGKARQQPYFTFPTFDALCDEYFSRLDVAKAERNEVAAKGAALKRVARIREGHAQQMAQLQDAQRENFELGALIESASELVDQACLVVRSALEHSVPWTDLAKLVELETANGNPVASAIADMDLAKGNIKLALRDYEAMEAAKEAKRERLREERRAAGLASDDEDEDDDDEDDDEDEVAEEEEEEAGGSDNDAEGGSRKPNSGKGKAKSGKQQQKGAKKGKGAQPAARKLPKYTKLVEVSVFETAAANARKYYQAAKSAREKESKTAAVAEQALRKAEKTVEQAAARQLAASAAVRAIRVARKPMWFEKFHWFITSEGLIVVAGKNAQDNELLVRRYLRAQDAYVHADTRGAATVILRHFSDDPTAAATLPNVSLEQAGAFCVCLSSAWAAHTVTGAWWVNAQQVSKTAPTGEYLTTGSFMIRGKKNYLPPTKLEMGFAVLFKVDESCVDAHLGDRYVRGSLRDVDEAAAEDAADEAADTATALSPSADTAAAAQQEAEAAEEEGEEIVLEGGVEGDGNEDGDAADDAAEGDGDEEAEGEGEVEGSGSSESEEERKPAKGKQPGNAPAAGPPGKKLTQKELAALRAGSQQQQQAKPQSSGRGKHGKSKKAQKYADQDEEDRELAMAALGHKKAAPVPAPAPTAPASSAASKGDKKGDKKGQKQGGKGGKGERTEQQPASAEAEAEGAATPTPAATEKPAHERKPRGPRGGDAAALADDDDAAAAKEQAGGGEAERRMLAALVASPLPGDILTHAVPMLAPYSVTLAYKYRCKLVPGSLKKGKASQAALHVWNTQAAAAAKAAAYAAAAASATEGETGTRKTTAGGVLAGAMTREQELMRSLAEPDLVQTILGNCKVMSVGGPGEGGGKGGKGRKGKGK